MPRLKQVPRNEANEYISKYYEALFGERDPGEEPGTATGTPGNWWTVFALVPYIFEHATNCLLYTSPSPRDVEESRMPSSA